MTVLITTEELKTIPRAWLQESLNPFAGGLGSIMPVPCGVHFAGGVSPMSGSTILVFVVPSPYPLSREIINGISENCFWPPASRRGQIAKANQAETTFC